MGREYVDEFVHAARTPIRPGREVGQEDHVAWVVREDDGMERENPMNPFEATQKKKSGKKASRKEMDLPSATLPFSRPPPESTNVPAPPPPPPSSSPKRKSSNTPIPKRHIPSIDFFGRAQVIHNEPTPPRSSTSSTHPSAIPEQIESPPASSSSTTGFFPIRTSHHPPLPPRSSITHPHPHPTPPNPTRTSLLPRNRPNSSIYSRAIDDPSSPHIPIHDNPFSPSFEFSDIEEEGGDPVMRNDSRMQDLWEMGSDWNGDARRMAAKRGTGGTEGWWEAVGVGRESVFRESRFIDSYRERGEEE